VKTGLVKFYGRMKGWGFILPDDFSDDFFVHHRDIVGRKFLKEGQLVRFQVGEWNGKPCAIRVEVTQEAPVAPPVTASEVLSQPGTSAKAVRDES
jgi:cold shock CspA family protein